MNLVLDSSAVIALLKNEEGGALVGERIENEIAIGQIVALHSMNAIEVFYEYSRAADVLTARAILQELASIGIAIHSDLDAAFCEDVAQIKADWKRVSLADCFGVALARRLDAEFLTTDHRELEPLRAAQIAHITFIR